jgi:hypothetical protein
VHRANDAIPRPREANSNSDWFWFDREMEDTQPEGEPQTPAPTQTLSLPPAAPVPRVRFVTKTRIRRVRCAEKRFAPQEFSGLIGNGQRLIHSSHSLCGGRGLVWCWVCGRFATTAPRFLCSKCPGVANISGRANISRLKRGLPPYPLKGQWPDGEDTLFRQLKIVN